MYIEKKKIEFFTFNLNNTFKISNIFNVNVSNNRCLIISEEQILFKQILQVLLFLLLIGRIKIKVSVSKYHKKMNLLYGTIIYKIPIKLWVYF